MGVFGEHVRGQTKKRILYVQQAKIGKGLAWKRALLYEKLEFLETRARLFVHVHDGDVVQGYGVQLGFGTRRHVG